MVAGQGLHIYSSDTARPPKRDTAVIGALGSPCRSRPAATIRGPSTRPAAINPHGGWRATRVWPCSALTCPTSRAEPRCDLST